jgi:hypothetical protein
MFASASTEPTLRLTFCTASPTSSATRNMDGAVATVATLSSPSGAGSASVSWPIAD